MAGLRPPGGSTLLGRTGCAGQAAARAKELTDRGAHLTIVHHECMRGPELDECRVCVHARLIHRDDAVVGSVAEQAECPRPTPWCRRSPSSAPADAAAWRRTPARRAAGRTARSRCGRATTVETARQQGHLARRPEHDDVPRKRSVRRPLVQRGAHDDPTQRMGDDRIRLRPVGGRLEPAPHSSQDPAIGLQRADIRHQRGLMAGAPEVAGQS